MIKKLTATISKKLKKILAKYHKYLLVVAIILSSIAISIRGNDADVKLVLHNYPALITLLITASLFLVAIYFRINEKKFLSLSSQIKDLSKDKSAELSTLIDDLTERQKEVYDLIISGKTNKEIRTELFIE